MIEHYHLVFPPSNRVKQLLLCIYLVIVELILGINGRRGGLWQSLGFICFLSLVIFFLSSTSFIRELWLTVKKIEILIHPYWLQWIIKVCEHYKDILRETKGNVSTPQNMYLINQPKLISCVEDTPNLHSNGPCGLCWISKICIFILCEAYLYLLAVCS